MARLLLRLVALLACGVLALLVTLLVASYVPLWALLAGWAFVATLLIYGAVVWDRVDAYRAEEESRG